METAEGDIDKLEGRATSLESRTTIVEEATAALTEWVEEADETLIAHGSDITNLQGRTLNIENRLSVAENDIDKVENRATALESRTEVVENLTSSLNSWAEELDHNLKEYYGYEDIGQDAFYFIDKEKNVVAVVDSAGLTTTNVTIKEGNNVKNIKDNVMFFETLGSINITIK
jgi:chromosome segregation ATPase